MADKEEPTGDTPRPTTETDADNDATKQEADAGDTDQPQGDSIVTEDQWDAMLNILQTIYDHRSSDGHDPSKVFHKKVNKRIVPDYYDVIKEPIAMSTIKARLSLHQYRDFPHFVRDFALIPHNAQVYNRPGAGAYHDALEVKGLLEQELAKLVESKVITEEEAKLPFLGDIPEEEELPPVQEGEEEEEEEDEGEESDDSQAGRGRKRGRKSTKRDDSVEAAQAADTDPRKRRGRPPKVDTPIEARIKNILKFMRRPKNDQGYHRIDHFERLPDKIQEPGYYNDIKSPMAVDMLKKKLKRKKYNTVEQFMVDVNLMFDNAKAYNIEDSIIYKDAVELQSEARQFAKMELEKPDSDFASEDGRIPLPNGVEHNGEFFKVGDWVHIQNPNDLSKPIPTQIYRTWKDVSGQQFINACWYYRPEQTVHRFDKHFFEGEVVKTGQYRDHGVDEIVDRCFIMFVTRFNKGRPRGFPSDKHVYVCESRYNEEKHTFNKIKTWASCLPDEVRDKDYEMDMFPQPKRMKKKPSPIAYLIKDEQKESDDLPVPTWGSDSAPPTIGAVHRRPRDAKDSPPPERTPTPPPKLPTPPPPPPQPTPVMNQPVANGTPRPQSNGYQPNLTPRQPSLATPNMMQQQRTYQPPAVSPAPRPQVNPAPLSRGYPQSQTPGYQPQIQPQATHSQNYMPNRPGAAMPYPGSQTYSAPQPIEAWYLPDAANAQIPRDIAAQFNRDEYGRVLFFTAPPVDIPISEDLANLGHSAKFLATRREREEARRQKRKERDEADAREEMRKTKALKLEEQAFDARARELEAKAVQIWSDGLAAEAIAELKGLYGDNWKRELMLRLEDAGAELV